MSAFIDYMLPKEMPRAQLLTSNSAIQMMENPLSSLKSLAIPWLSLDLTTLAMDMSLAIVCGVGLFLLLLLLPCFKGNPPSPTPVRKNKMRKHHVEKRGQMRRKNKSALKACRDTQEELEDIHDLVSLLTSHLGKLSDNSSSRHLLKGDTLGEVVKSASAAAHPAAGHCEEDAFSSTASPKASPAPSHEGLQPLASALSPVQTCSSVPAETQSHHTVPQPPELLIPLEHPSPRSLSPPPLACTPPSHDSNSGLPSNFREVPPESNPRSGSPTNSSQVPSPSPALNSDILELLEVVISKRAKENAGEEKEHPLDSLGNMMKSLGRAQDAAIPQAFWNTKGESQQLPESPELLLPMVLQKCSQLFWGLPFLHSESLVAPVQMSGQPLVLPSVLFNTFYNFMPAQDQDNVLPQHFPPQPLLQHFSQSQNYTPALTWCQPLPLADSQAQAHVPSYMPVLSSHSPPVNSCTVPPVVQHLEHHLARKHLESQRILPAVVNQSLKAFTQDQGLLHQRDFIKIPGEFISFEMRKKLENHLQERLIQHLHKRNCETQVFSGKKSRVTDQAEDKPGCSQNSRNVDVCCRRQERGTSESSASQQWGNSRKDLEHHSTGVATQLDRDAESCSADGVQTNTLRESENDDCDADTFLQECGPDVLLGTNVLASQSSLSSSQNFSRSSTSTIYESSSPLRTGGHSTKQEPKTSITDGPWYSKVFHGPEEAKSCTLSMRAGSHTITTLGQTCLPESQCL
ncbi:spermatogenesis-associated protein 31E1-like [Thomomys bottae]